jgi:hypothetical protein
MIIYKKQKGMVEETNNIVTCVRFPWQRDVGALSRGSGMVQHCCVSLATQQLKRRAYQQAAWLCTQQKTRFYGIRNSTDMTSVCWNSLEFRRVCIWLRTPFGCKTEFVSGNCEMST